MIFVPALMVLEKVPVILETPTLSLYFTGISMLRKPCDHFDWQQPANCGHSSFQFYLIKHPCLFYHFAQYHNY